MEEAVMFPPATMPNLQTSRHPWLTMRGHTYFLFTGSLDSIRYQHRMSSENPNKYFDLEGVTERGLDYDKGNPTKGRQSQ